MDALAAQAALLEEAIAARPAPARRRRSRGPRLPDSRTQRSRSRRPPSAEPSEAGSQPDPGPEDQPNPGAESWGELGSGPDAWEPADWRSEASDEDAAPQPGSRARGPRAEAEQRNWQDRRSELAAGFLWGRAVRLGLCEDCRLRPAVVACSSCAQPARLHMCGPCDSRMHGRAHFHRRTSLAEGFHKPIPNTISFDSAGVAHKGGGCSVPHVSCQLQS